LSARSHRGCTGEKSDSENAVVHTSRPISDVPNQLNARSSLDDLLADLNTREPAVEQEAHARSSSDNAFGGVEWNVLRDEMTANDFFSTLLNSRDLGSGQEIEARNLFSDLFQIGGSLLKDFLKRDLTPDHLAARDDAEDFVKSILGSRDSSGFIDALNTLASSRRDVAPGELAARGDWEDFVKTLNTRELVFKRDLHARGLFTGILSWVLHKIMSLSVRARDLIPDDLAGRNTVDDFLNTYTSNHATREPSPQQEIQARGIPDAPETVARDGSATDAFIKALLSSRDTSKSLTADDVLSLASLASRALDELD
jgi:hypothetical protein